MLWDAWALRHKTHTESAGPLALKALSAHRLDYFNGSHRHTLLTIVLRMGLQETSMGQRIPDPPRVVRNASSPDGSKQAIWA